MKREGFSSVLLKGIVRAFDPVTYLASVQIVGSTSSNLDSVEVARNILAADMIAGRYCALSFFDSSNPEDAVVIAVWE